MPTQKPTAARRRQIPSRPAFPTCQPSETKGQTRKLGSFRQIPLYPALPLISRRPRGFHFNHPVFSALHNGFVLSIPAAASGTPVFPTVQPVETTLETQQLVSFRQKASDHRPHPRPARVYTAFTMRGRLQFCATSLLACLALTANGEVRFNRDIRPIMSDTCFRCHGPDKSSRMAGMRLDIRDEALKPTASGVMPIVPGDPEKSEIIQRIFADRIAARVMPPACTPQGADRGAEGDHPPMGGRGRGVRRPLGLSAGEAAGRARWPTRRRSAIPSTPSSRSAWPREGLTPSPEADRRTLHPPRHARSHRPSAHARGSRRLPERHFSERL